MKVCSRCKQPKQFNQFSKDKSSKNGLKSGCKSCIKEYRVKNAIMIAEKLKEYGKNNTDKISKQKKAYYKINANKIKKLRKEYYESNASKIIERSKKYSKEKLKSDPLYKLSENIRNLVRNSFKRNTKNFHKNSSTVILLGCTIPELRDHLQKKFQPGMAFENHGEWHIDHIIPLASAKTQEEIERLCHYTNLQPLWASDNIRKGKKY